MQITHIQTPLGIARIEGDENGVAVISILNNEEIDLLKISQPLELKRIAPDLEVAVSQLTAYFDGKRNGFSFKINPKGTDFQQKVWQELCNIPFGKTISYLDLAKKLGDPKVIRAAASANGKNPLWIVVPCHRVIGIDGSLTGYAGGLW